MSTTSKRPLEAATAAMPLPTNRHVWQSVEHATADLLVHEMVLGQQDPQGLAAAGAASTGSAST